MSRLVSARNVPKLDAHRAQLWFAARGIPVKVTHDGVTSVEVVAWGDTPPEAILAALKLALRYDPGDWHFEHTEFKVIPC